jgi:hypothetical protein
MTYE